MLAPSLVTSPPPHLLVLGLTVAVTETENEAD